MTTSVQNEWNQRCPIQYLISFLEIQLWFNCQLSMLITTLKRRFSILNLYFTSQTLSKHSKSSPICHISLPLTFRSLHRYCTVTPMTGLLNARLITFPIHHNNCNLRLWSPLIGPHWSYFIPFVVTCGQISCLFRSTCHPQSWSFFL